MTIEEVVLVGGAILARETKGKKIFNQRKNNKGPKKKLEMLPGAFVDS